MNRLIGLLITLMLFAAISEASNQMKFRVQCASSQQNLSAELLKKLPEIQMYILPTGIKLFFWEGYCSDLKEAENILRKVKEMGFRGAYIRVFNGDVLLSKLEGDPYIASLRKKDEPTVVSNDKIKQSVKDVPTEKESKKRVTKTKVVVIEDTSEKSPEKIQPELLEENIIVKEEMPTEPTKSGGEAAYVNSTMVPYPPVFRIYLTNVSVDSLIPSVVSQLKHETIYMYKQNGQKYYLVGTYENHHAAFRELQKYKSITSKANVVAEFRDRMISLDLAVDLYDRYYNTPKRY
jgi:hypothetical protein